MHSTVSSPNVKKHPATVSRALREAQSGYKSVVLWFTGLSGAGKSTLAHAVEEKLHQMGCRTFVLDGDNVRHGLCADLGFSMRGRQENIRRIGELVKLFVDAGMIALTAFISPFRNDRRKVREMVGRQDFIEIYCRCPMEICEQRDAKGLYARARAGGIEEFTGISSPYEAPEQPELILDTDRESLENCVKAVVNLLIARNIIRPWILPPDTRN